jgi:hypothetical protein
MAGRRRLALAFAFAFACARASAFAPGGAIFEMRGDRAIGASSRHEDRNV